ncbi:MAG: ABC transporter substrate-binding protein [Acidobacteriota bacterium]
MRVRPSRRRFLSLMPGATTALGASSLSRALAMAPVRIATSVTPPSIHNISLHVAYERGFFRANGIDVTEFLQLRGGPLATQAIAAGQVDAAPADAEGLLAAVQSGHALRAVAAPGAQLSYMVAVRKEIRTAADLSGKPFAISRPGAISQYLMYPLLDRERVPRDSLQWLGVGGALERMLALKAGRVQGALLMIDFAMEAIRDPDIRILKPVADLLPNYPVKLLVLRKDMLDRNPDASFAITRAIIQACRYIVEHKKETIDVVLKYAPGMDTVVLERAYDELIRIRGFGVNGGMSRANMTAAHDLALQNLQIQRPVALDHWADFRFQDRAVAQLGRYPG